MTMENTQIGYDNVVSLLNMRTSTSPEDTAMSINLIERWCDWYAAGDAAASTIRLRRYHLLRLAARHPQVLEVTEDNLIDWMGSLAHTSPSARKSMLASLRSFYKWAQRTGLITADPTLGLRRIATPEGLPKPIPEVALQQALAAADKETTLMLLLGAYAGLRRAEIAGIHSDDITDMGLMVKGKGRKVRRIPIHPILAAALVDVKGYAFPGRWDGPVNPDYVANRLEAVLPAPHTAHSLRHRFATQTYRACKDIRVTQQLLGHSSIQTTVRYVMVDEDALAAAVNAVA